jgi:hypothetical protein
LGLTPSEARVKDKTTKSSTSFRTKNTSFYKNHPDDMQLFYFYCRTRTMGEMGVMGTIGMMGTMGI